jgi:hypothetical protein
MSWLSKARAALHGSAAHRAADAEADEIARYANKAGALERRLAEQFALPSTSGAVPLGRALEWNWQARMPVSKLAAHALIVGPSGSGKSYFTALLLQGLLASGVQAFTVLDPKAETVELMKAVVAGAASRLTPERRRRLFERVVLFDLFGTRALPRLNVLAPVQGLDEESHAFQIALLFSDMSADVGVRQEAILYLVVLCLLKAALPITVLPTALEAPLLLERLALQAGPAELFRTTASRLKKEGRERILGLMSRAERVLRLRATRLALGADGCIDFGKVLGLVSLVNLAPPQGAADISRVLSGLLWMGISHAIRRRANGAARCHLVIDEAPTFLAAGGARMADSLEDLFRLARSKGVYVTALTQDLSSIAKVSSSLPETLRTNMHLVALFRCLADAHWDFVLPVTGRRPKAERAPWEESRGGYLERSAEMQFLRGELQRLPDRECYFADRRTGLPGVRLRTADLKLTATRTEIMDLEEAAHGHPMLASVRELERAAESTARRVAALLDVGQHHLAESDRAPVRRARGKLDIG